MPTNVGERYLTPYKGRGAALAAAFLGWMFDGFEMGLFPLVARPALRELLGPDAAGNLGAWTAAILAGFLVGAAIGGLLFGWLGDRVGRVRALVWSVLAYALFSGVCAFAAAPWQLLALRFLAALGMGGEWALGVALVVEIWPSSARPMLASLIGAAANVGFLLTALAGLALASVVGTLADGLEGLGLAEGDIAWWLGDGRSGWRVLLLLGAAPAVLTFFIRLWVPESERWKESVKGRPQVRVREIFGRGLARTTLLATGLGAIALLGMWGSTQWIPSWADRLGAGDPAAKAHAQIATAAGSILGSALAAFVAEWLSRRRAFFLLSLLSLVACALLFRLPLAFGPLFLTLAFIAGAATAGFFGWLPLYLPELFPTRLRATGQGFAFNAGRLFAAAGTLFTGRLLDAFDEDYARTGAVTSLVYVLGLVLIWWCPETKGRPLPE